LVAGFRKSRVVSPTCPPKVEELANACISYVERAVGVKLDFEPETLPLLDHYLAEARDSLSIRPEVSPLIVHAMAAYFGEVARRRHGGTWHVGSQGPGAWRVELESVLSFSPVHVIAVALGTVTVGADLSVFDDLDPAVRESAVRRLAELPPVSDREFHSASAWLEVMDIVVDIARARRGAPN